MSLTERRAAVKAELDKAKRLHRPTRELQREYEVLTAGVIAEKMKAKRSLPEDAFQPCHLVRPDLWDTFCRLQGRPNEPSEHWTTWDVVNVLTRKLLEASQTDDGTPRLPN